MDTINSADRPICNNSQPETKNTLLTKKLMARLYLKAVSNGFLIVGEYLARYSSMPVDEIDLPPKQLFPEVYQSGVADDLKNCLFLDGGNGWRTIPIFN